MSGAAAFMMADAVLEKKHVGLVGMDLSYYDDTPYRNTQYYDAMLKVADEEDLGSVFHTHTQPAYRPVVFHRSSLHVVSGIVYGNCPRCGLYDL